MFEKKNLALDILQGRNIAVEPLPCFGFYNSNERGIDAMPSASPERDSNVNFDIFVSPSMASDLQASRSTA